MHSAHKQSENSGIVRLSSIKSIVEGGSHPLLDVTPAAIDKLNYAGLYPIVIFLKTDTKQRIKEIRVSRQK